MNEREVVVTVRMVVRVCGPATDEQVKDAVVEAMEQWDGCTVAMIAGEDEDTELFCSEAELIDDEDGDGMEMIEVEDGDGGVFTVEG